MVIIGAVFAIAGLGILLMGIQNTMESNSANAEPVTGTAFSSQPVNKGNDPLKNIWKKKHESNVQIYYETIYEVCVRGQKNTYTDTELTTSAVEQGTQKEFFVNEKGEVFNKATAVKYIKYGTVILICGALMIAEALLLK